MDSFVLRTLDGDQLRTLARGADRLWPCRSLWKPLYFGIGIIYTTFRVEIVCCLHSIPCFEVIPICNWLLNILDTEYKSLGLLKESPRGNEELLRHKASGRKFILCRFVGNAEAYQKLLSVSCPNLPLVYEVAGKNGEQLVLEEYIEGDTLDFLLRDALFTPEETKTIITQVCQALGVLHSMKAVHRDIKLESSTDTQVLGTTGFAAPEQYGMNTIDELQALVDEIGSTTDPFTSIVDIHLPSVTYEGGLVLDTRYMNIYASRIENNTVGLHFNVDGTRVFSSV